MLWKKQEKKVKGHGLCFVSKKSFIHISDIKYRDSQDKVVHMMMEHLYTLIMKHIKRYAEVTEFCDRLQQAFHQKELSNVLYMYMKLLKFTMRMGFKIRFTPLVIW